jgi:predicted kinase
MRGVSGSGKSTLARKIAEQEESVVYSTDDFFMVEGQYKFVPERLGEFHAANQTRTEMALRDQCPLVIVDNTNCRAWEMRPYVQMALKHGYTVEIVEPLPVGFDELMSRQAQREDQNKALGGEIVRRMLDRYEKDLTVEQILGSKS